MLSPGVGYFRREAVPERPACPTSRLVNDEYAAYLGWNPAGGPRSEFQFIRTNTFDGERAFQDITKDFGSLVSTFNRGTWACYYRGSYLRHERPGRSARDPSGVARAVVWTTRESFIRKRLLWNATYNVNHQDLTTAATGEGGEVALPVTPFAGLVALSDTPVTVTLPQNAAAHRRQPDGRRRHQPRPAGLAHRRAGRGTSASTC